MAAHAETMMGSRPPLKWAGSKYRLVEQIGLLLPPGKRLVEPFVGSGAVFLNCQFDRYLINDANEDLILFYSTLRREKTRFIEYSRRLFTPSNNTSERYYVLREEFNRSTPSRRRAALFLYLNKHGYNGLCRYNSSGELNVPFGRYRAPYFPRREMIAFLAKASRLKIEGRDFEAVIASCKRGDVVYCDPPYVPLSATSNFTSYSAGGFSLDDQKRLAGLAEEAASRGVPVLISNHNTSFTRSLYASASSISFIDVRRHISCNGQKREFASELLALFNGQS